MPLPFEVPTDLGSLSSTELTALRAKVREQVNTFAALDVADVNNETIEDMKTLRTLLRGIDETRELRKGAAGEFAALHTELGDTDDEVEAEEPEAEEEPPAAPAAQPKAKATTASATKRAPSVAEVASTTDQAPQTQVPVAAPAVIVASANVPNYAGGAEIDWLDVGKIVESRVIQMSAMGPGQYSRQPVAQVKIPYPAELTASGGLESDATSIIDFAASERRLPGGSLLASLELKRKQAGVDSLTAAGTGWCAPSEVLYDLCELESNDGMLDLPEINVSRGGVKYTAGPDFSSIWSGAGYFHLTEAQIIAGSTKPVMAVACPTFTDTRLDADGLAIQADLLTLRGYPELTARFVRGAMVAHNHKINQWLINALVSGSTALSLPSNVSAHTPGTGSTWSTDHSVVSYVLQAVEMAIVDYKYRQRMALGATIEVVLPYWVLSWMRADMTRRAIAGLDTFNVTDAMITDWFTQRKARVQFVYDWQDAYYWGAYPTGAPATIQRFGGDISTTDFLQDWPHTLQMLLFAAGTWVRGNADIITLDTVYDSTLLSQNKATQLFTEQGILAAKTCFDSRIYTIGAASGTFGLVGGLEPLGTTYAPYTAFTNLAPTNP